MLPRAHIRPCRLHPPFTLGITDNRRQSLALRPLKQLARTFNRGTRMESVCDEAAVGTIIAIARGFGVHAQRIGHTERSRHKRELTIRLGAETEHFVADV
jgi:hypothetical protein